ncbi:phosphonate C-P lyase system protein PhnG [Nocardia sp. NPDC004711]
MTEHSTTTDGTASPSQSSADPGRDARVGLLARADRDTLIRLADDCLQYMDVELRSGPQLGTVLFQVREPIERRRFYLGDVLVTEARVRLGEHEGWAMRLGDDPEATVAAAVCDAALQSATDHRADILALCASTQTLLRAQRLAEMAEIAATAVEFEELGG